MLAAAAALAILATVATVVSPSIAVTGAAPSWRSWRIGEHPAEVADQELAPLRQAIPRGALVGYLSPWRMAEFMAREPDVQRFYSAQYALAPAVLKPIYLPECAARGPWACGLAQTDFLLATDQVAAHARELGLEWVRSAGPMTLLRRIPR
jgi:hypothetical protein